MKTEIKKTGFHAGTAFCAALVSLLLLASLGCAGSSQPAQDGPPKAAGVKNLVLVPFKDISAIYGPYTEVRSPISGNLFYTGPVAKDSATFLTNQVQAFLETTEYNLMPMGLSDGAWFQAASEEGPGNKDMAVLIRMGENVGADAVVAGYLYRFRDREGNRYSVDKPASVAFELYMIRVADGRVLWSARMDEAQKPLSENLLNVGEFIQRGGTWVTADKLASQGLEKRLQSFPKP